MNRSVLVLATHNAHKIEEFGEILCDYPFEVKDLRSYPESSAPDETGSTYAENALLKAREACRITALPSLADDSGLEVDALDGAPGLYSARYAGPNSSQSEKITYLLQQLGSHPQRTARFRAVIALVHPDGREWISEGLCEGSIALKRSGEHGFGYDPIFYLDRFAKTMAELQSSTKHRISHRGRALFGLIEQLHATLPNYPTF